MAEHEVAKAAVETSNVWTFLTSLAGTLGIFVGKHFLWDKPRKSKEAPSIREMLESMTTDMAVMRATVATKEDLNEATDKMADKTRVMVDAVHNRVSDHLRDHAKAA